MELVSPHAGVERMTFGRYRGFSFRDFAARADQVEYGVQLIRTADVRAPNGAEELPRSRNESFYRLCWFLVCVLA
eukprot:12880609-Prorocentrum_lima.AAC.1